MIDFLKDEFNYRRGRRESNKRKKPPLFVIHHHLEENLDLFIPLSF